MSGGAQGRSRWAGGALKAMRAEGAYITLLRQARSYKLAGDTLTLYGAHGNESLIFARAKL